MPQVVATGPCIQLRLLGPPEVMWDGRGATSPDTADSRPLTFRTRKTLCLFVYLALTAQVCSRERLAALLWPEHNEASGRTLLRNTLAFLRQGLADATNQPRTAITLVRGVRDPLGREALVLDAVSAWPRLLLDSEALERAAALAQRTRLSANTTVSDTNKERAQLEAGVSAYRGPFLEGVIIDDAPEFDDWITQQRAYWLRLFERACSRLSELQLDQGAFTEAAATAQAWVAASPLNEAATQQLMRALAAAGDRTEALAAYAALKQMLDVELGTQPTDDTTALAELLRQSTRAIVPVTTTAPPPRADATIARTLSIPFVGRSAEFEAMVAAYEAVANGEGARALMLEGEGGIGKTRLADQFANWATVQGADVLRGHAVEALGRLPYQPLVDALRPRVERERAPDDLLADVWLAELVRILPELHDRYPDLPAPNALPSDDPSGQGRLYEAVVQLGQALALRLRAAGGVLILFLDDLQWIDAATRDLLQYGARRWAEERVPLLLLLTVRVEGADNVVAPYLRAMRDSIPLSRLPLTALTPDEIQQALHIVSSPRTADEHSEQGIRAFGVWLRERTGGQPFYLVQMLRTLLDRGVIGYERDSPNGDVLLHLPAASDLQQIRRVVPGTVRNMLRERLEALSPNARDLLFAGAVLGEGLTFELICRVADITEREALSAVDELLGGRLLTDVVAERGALPSQETPLAFAQDLVREVSYTEAGEARRRVFHRNALGALEQTGSTPAAELARHAEGAGLAQPLWRHSLAAGDAAMGLFAVHDALPHYETAWRLLSRDGRAAGLGQFDPLPDERAHLCLQLARVYELTNQVGKARATYEAMYGFANEQNDQSLAWRARTRLAVTGLGTSNGLETAVAELRQGLELAETMGDANKLAETYWNLALVHLVFRQPVRVLEFAQHALRDAQAAGNKEAQARSLFLIGTAYDTMSAWEQAIAPLEESRSMYDTLAWAVEAAAGAEHRVIRHTDLTSIGVQPLWAGAGPVTGIAYRTMQATGLYESAANRNNYGDPHEGIALAHEAMRIAREINDKTALVMSAHELVRGLTEIGQYEEALAVAEDHRATAQGLVPFHRATFLAAGVAACLAIYLDTVDEASAEVESISGRIAPNPGRWGQNLRCVARALAGDWPAAGDAARAATEDRIHHHIGPFYHWWYAYYETEALLRSGEIELARQGVHAVSERSSQSRRCQLVTLRMRALLAAFEARSSDAIGHLEEALGLAEQIGLRGEQWQIAASLARVHESSGHASAGQQMRKRAHAMVSELAGGLTNPSLRANYLTEALRVATAPAPLLEAHHGLD